MPKLADRVAETTTTTGTGPVTLLGAKAGYRAFLAGFSLGDSVYYAIAGATEWESGIGTISGGLLLRDTVLSSSNAGTLVNFSAGTKDVFAAAPAESLMPLGPFASTAALQTAKPAASYIGRTALVGEAAPYAVYVSAGNAWMQTLASNSGLGGLLGTLTEADATLLRTKLGISNTPANATTTLVAPAAAIPLDGNKSYSSDMLMSTAPMTIAAGQIEGGSCSMAIKGVGSGAWGGITGAQKAKGSSAFNTAAGAVNHVLVWVDCGRVRYTVSQSDPVEVIASPVAPSWASAPVLASATAGSAASVTTIGASGSPAPTLTYSWAVAGVQVATSSTYTPVTADVGKTLTVTVTATNSAGAASATSNGVTVAAAAPAATVPGAPTALTLGAVTDTGQALSWTAPASNGGSAITGYQIGRRLTSAGGAYTYTSTGSTATSGSVSGLTASTQYDYVVRAVNSVGNSADSAAVSGSTTATATPPSAQTAITRAIVGTALFATNQTGVSASNANAAGGVIYTATAANSLANNLTERIDGGPTIMGLANAVLWEVANTSSTMFYLSFAAAGSNTASRLRLSNSVLAVDGYPTNYTQTLITALSATPSSTAWYRGTDWASAASCVNAELYRVRYDSADKTLNIEASLNAGVSWLNLAKINDTAATGVKISSCGTNAWTGLQSRMSYQ